MATKLQDLDIKLFADGADKAQIAKQPWIKGFTTTPSLMKAAGVTDYVSYARELVAAAPDRHIFFEVFSDDIPEMIEQARVISTWGPNVYVKLPVTTTRGEPLFQAVHALSRDGIQINLTAVFTVRGRLLFEAAHAAELGIHLLRRLLTSEQVVSGIEALSGGAPACVSVFAGRLADAGIDHRPIMRDAVARARQTGNVEIIWASTREVFNVIEANEIECHIITAPAAVLKKLPSLGTITASELSLDPVKAFREDAVAAGLLLPVAAQRAAE
jgi:transaldolase